MRATLRTHLRQLFTLCSLLLLAACAAPHSQGRAVTIDWRARARHVVPGMTRTEVEALLPAWGGLPGALLSPPRVTTVTGGGYAEVYWVAPDWRVTLIYDGTGGADSAQNRVQKPVSLQQINYPGTAESRP